MAGSELETRLTHLARTCMSLRWELKSILGDGDRLPVDLAIALQLLDGKAELAALSLRRHQGAAGDMVAVPARGADTNLMPPPTVASVATVVDRISSL